MEAKLGVILSISNRVRAFLLVKYYRNEEWDDRIEVGLGCFSSMVDKKRILQLRAGHSLRAKLLFFYPEVSKLSPRHYNSNQLSKFVNPVLSITSRRVESPDRKQAFNTLRTSLYFYLY